MALKRARKKKTPDLAAARELHLFADNTSGLYPQKVAILRNLAKRVRKGTYDPQKARRLWLYWVDAAAKAYGREFGGGGMRSPSVGGFDRATREEVAKDLERHERGEIDLGNVP